MYVNKTPEIVAMLQKTFPSYSGNKIQIKLFKGPMGLNSYWDSGSRDYYVILEMATGKLLEIGSNHPTFEPGKLNHIDGLLPGFLVAKHTIFCGKDMGVTFFLNSENLTPLLPEKKELTPGEKIVLYATRHLKSSYGGIKNFRFHEANKATDISIAYWDHSKATLIDKGMLNKSGAITIEGRNAIDGMNSFPKAEVPING